MKLIGKVKDYYDYIVGINGEDPLITFRRGLDPKAIIVDNNEIPYNLDHLRWRNPSARSKHKNVDSHEFKNIKSIDGVKTTVNNLDLIVVNCHAFPVLNKTLTVEELARLCIEKDLDNESVELLFNKKGTTFKYFINRFYKHDIRWKRFHELLNTPVFKIDLNELFKTRYWNGKEYVPLYSKEIVTKVRTRNSYVLTNEYPVLAQYDFGKVLSAEDCYMLIYDFFMNKEPLLDSISNESKIEKHGFDKKKSFRNMKRE